MATISEKKDHIYNIVFTGLSLSRAFILAGCTPSEQDKIRRDKKFMSLIKYRYAEKELELLEQHDKAMAVAASKGITRPIEWRLAVLNPEKFGQKQTVLPPKETPPITQDTDFSQLSNEELEALANG